MAGILIGFAAGVLVAFLGTRAFNSHASNVERRLRAKFNLPAPPINGATIPAWGTSAPAPAPTSVPAEQHV